MLKVDNTQMKLENLLNEAYFDFDKPNCYLAWEVFKKYASIIVDCADDAFLFQCGTYTFTGEEMFEFEFVRQFTIEEDEEYEHMEQLSLTLYYIPDEELKGIETNLWSYDFDTIDVFFEAVESMNEFNEIIKNYTPKYCTVAQEEV